MDESLQIIGTTSAYANLEEGLYKGQDDCGDSVYNLVCKIRTFYVYVDSNPLHPSEANYHVKVTEMDGKGKRTGAWIIVHELNPIKDAEEKEVMTFTLYKSMDTVDEHYTNVSSSFLQQITEWYGPHSFRGKKGKTCYVQQFNKYLTDIWQKKPKEEDEQKPCSHVKRKGKKN